MKRSQLLSHLVLATLVLGSFSCGKKDKSSSAAPAAPVTNPATPGTNPVAPTNGAVTSMEQLVANFNAVPDTQGLTAGQVIDFTIKDYTNIVPTNNTLNNIFQFLNIQSQVVNLKYEVIKVENLDNQVLSIRTGVSQWNLGSPIQYSKDNDADLNLILSRHNGAATVNMMKAAKVYFSQTNVKNATYIQMSRGGKIYEYVVSTELPLISNPIYSYDGLKKESKQLNGVQVQVLQ